MGLFLLVKLFDLCRLENDHGTAAAALLAPAAPPPVLTEAAAAALLACAALPPVLADATAAALLAVAALPPVLADSTATALLALAALPPVLAPAFPHWHRERSRPREHTKMKNANGGGTEPCYAHRGPVKHLEPSRLLPKARQASYACHV